MASTENNAAAAAAIDEQDMTLPANTSDPDVEKRAPDETSAAHKKREIRGVRWLTVCAAIYATCFLYGLDTTIAADVQGAVIEAFGHVDQYTWIGAGFPLGSVCVILLLGTLFNTFDLKWVYVTTVVIFEAGSAICGAAPNMNALIVGRVVAGAGGSGIYFGAMQYLTEMTEEEELGHYMASLAVFWGLGCVLGPLIGGAFAGSSASWRWAFYINLVVGAASAPAFLLCLPSISRSQGVSVRRRLASIDFVGFVLGSGVWVTFLLVFTMAGGQWPWNDGRTIATFVVFGVLLVTYVWQQRSSILTDPFQRAFPGHLLRDRTQVLLSVATAAGTTTMFVVVYYVPIYFQFVNDDGPLMAAVRLLPFIVVAVAANQILGAFLQRIKLYSMLYLIAGAFLVAGGGPLVTYLRPSTTTGTVYGLCILVAVGSGLSMVSGFTISAMTTQPKDTGAGLKMQMVAQIGGQVIALAVAGQIYRSRAISALQSALADQVYSRDELWAAVAGAQSDLFKTLEGELRDRALDAITHAMQMTFVLVPVAGAVMIAASLCMRWKKLSGGEAVAVGG